MTLMCAGVGLFGALSGIVASVFLGQGKEENEVLAELKSVRAEIAQLRPGATARDDLRADAK